MHAEALIVIDAEGTRREEIDRVLTEEQTARERRRRDRPSGRRAECT